ncbi:MAG: metallophosphoesterase [Anaerolineales bacterium]|nr:metallophosphoesterase [Anaerolineales bacterium]
MRVTFAVIGDYGMGDEAEGRVASLVQSWNPDLVLTVGDNNYPLGEAETIDAHIGQFYQDFIFPYTGAYGAGAPSNRFFPALGNHDLYSEAGQAYFDYFVLPGSRCRQPGCMSGWRPPALPGR